MTVCEWNTVPSSQCAAMNRRRSRPASRSMFCSAVPLIYSHRISLLLHLNTLLHFRVSQLPLSLHRPNSSAVYFPQSCNLKRIVRYPSSKVSHALMTPPTLVLPRAVMASIDKLTMTVWDQIHPQHCCIDQVGFFKSFLHLFTKLLIPHHSGCNWTINPHV